MSLKIYKASAGSGKTYTLAVEYIKFLVHDPTAYRRILAVTFTNKATAEMKARIVEQLYGLSICDPGSDSYLSSISEALRDQYTEQEIRTRAGKALQNILHDYSRFRVQTIDAFYQDVLQNLSKELNLTPGMSIELDTSKVVNQSVDHFITDLRRGDPELAWIEDFIKEKIRDDKRWDVTKETKKFAQNLFNETYMEFGKQQSELLHENPQLIDNYKKVLNALQEEAFQATAPYGERYAQLLQEHGIEDGDINKGSYVRKFFEKLQNLKETYEKKKDIDTIEGRTVQARMESADSWMKNNSKRREVVMQAAGQHLMPLLQEAHETLRASLTTVKTCKLSLRHLSKLQLLDSIDRKVNEDNRQANRFLLSNTNALLHDLIQEGDAQFIFEKIGANIQHVMIDEFQDTSRMQWDNFRLLFSNILAEGKDCLIVGDVKQSIYRWRGGDWNILNELDSPGNALARHVEKFTLGTNRRSEARVIAFNNALFSKALSFFRQLTPPAPEDELQKLEHAYKDVKQHTPAGRNPDSGYVKVTFLGKDSDYAKESIVRLGQEVQALLDGGVPMNQIAILLRTTTHLPEIAAYLETELHIPLVSGEAFLLNASTAVCLLIQALCCLNDAENGVMRAALCANYHRLHHPDEATDWHNLFQGPAEDTLPGEFITRQEELRQMPLYELLETLCCIFGLNELKHGQDAYLLYFFDQVAQFLGDKSSDIPSFLSYWEEELNRKSIPEGNTQGVRAITIHKSKGLQYHTVLLPFCDWTLEVESSYQNDQLLWCHTDKPPYNTLSVIPVSYGSTMYDSFYREAYEKERMQLWVDNLNLLYVALTRAEKNLIIQAKKGSTGKRISLLLETCIPQLAADGIGTWDADEAVYTLGTVCTGAKENNGTRTNKLTQPPTRKEVRMVSLPPKTSFLQSNLSADFIKGVSGEASPHKAIDRGNLLHRLFSTINTKADTEPAVAALVSQGVIGSREEQEEIISLVKHALEHPDVQGWYDGSWKLFNERDIIWMEHGQLMTRRPDRVMQRGNEITIIDFKFGRPQDKYRQQMRGYMKLLRSMSGTEKQICGYLWYVDEEKTEQVWI